MFLNILLYVLSICEVECGRFEIVNQSADEQNIVVQSLAGERIKGATMQASQRDTLRLTAGKYLITAFPADEHYRVTAQYCGYFNLCPLSLPENIEYVDMGLPSGTYWANMNLGATEPYECGCYFAFGETEPKEAFSWENYKWVLSAADRTTTKYNYDASWGTPVDSKMQLDSEDDAAIVHWGGGWQTPSAADIQELVDNVTFSVETRNGQKGMKVVSKTNGNVLFFPFAGYKEGIYVTHYNTDGGYVGNELIHSMWGYERPQLQTYISPNIRFRLAVWQRPSHYIGWSIRPVFKGTPPQQ